MKITIDNDARERWNGIEGLKGPGQEKRKNAAQWKLRLEASGTTGK